MTQTPEKVIKLKTATNLIAALEEYDNYLFIATKDDGEYLAYSYDLPNSMEWRELAVFLGYVELIKDRIMEKEEKKI